MFGNVSFPQEKKEEGIERHLSIECKLNSKHVNTFQVQDFQELIPRAQC